MTIVGDWFMVLWGGAISAVTIYDVWRGWRTKQWSTTTARILDVTPRYHKARLGSYLPGVRYQYTVDGQDFVGARFRFGARTFRSEGSARKAVGDIPVGKELPIRYDPQRPSNSVLHAGIDGSAVMWLVLGLAVLAFGIAQV